MIPFSNDGMESMRFEFNPNTPETIPTPFMAMPFALGLAIRNLALVPSALIFARPLAFLTLALANCCLWSAIEPLPFFSKETAAKAAATGLKPTVQTPSPPSLKYEIPAPKPFKDAETLGRIPRSLSHTAPKPMFPLKAEKASPPPTIRPVMRV